MKEYALYKGDQMVAIGTVKEIAEERGVEPTTIRFYKSQAYQRRSKREENNRLLLIKIEDLRGNNNMKFFDFYNPYTALIKAENEEQAIEKYVECVAEDKGDIGFDEIERDYAIVKFSQAKGEDGELAPLNEVLKQLQSDQPELLLMDGSLV